MFDLSIPLPMSDYTVAALHVPQHWRLADVLQLHAQLNFGQVELADTGLTPEDLAGWEKAKLLPAGIAWHEPTPIGFVWLRTLQHLAHVGTPVSVAQRVQAHLFAASPVQASPAGRQEALAWLRHSGVPWDEQQRVETLLNDEAVHPELTGGNSPTTLEALLYQCVLQRQVVGAAVTSAGEVVTWNESIDAAWNQLPHLRIPLTPFLLEFVSAEQRASFYGTGTLSAVEHAVVRAIRTGSYKGIALHRRGAPAAGQWDLTTSVDGVLRGAAADAQAALRLPVHGEVTVRRNQSGELYYEHHHRQRFA